MVLSTAGAIAGKLLTSGGSGGGSSGGSNTTVVLAGQGTGEQPYVIQTSSGTGNGEGGWSIWKILIVVAILAGAAFLLISVWRATLATSIDSWLPSIGSFLGGGLIGYLNPFDDPSDDPTLKELAWDGVRTGVKYSPAGIIYRAFRGR